MSFYRCGHDRGLLFITKKHFARQMMMYEDWVGSKGFDGNKKECFKCFVKNLDDFQKSYYKSKEQDFIEWKKHSQQSQESTKQEGKHE